MELHFTPQPYASRGVGVISTEVDEPSASVGKVAETRDFDENTQVDLDSTGQLVGITIEHASTRTDIPNLSFEQVAA